MSDPVDETKWPWDVADMPEMREKLEQLRTLRMEAREMNCVALHAGTGRLRWTLCKMEVGG